MLRIGNGGAEFGVLGYVSAYDADTGKQRWRFYTVPNPDKRADNAASDAIFASKGNATWSDTGEWKTSGGGGTVWDAIVYDKDLDRSIWASATAIRGTTGRARTARATTGSCTRDRKSTRQNSST